MLAIAAAAGVSGALIPSAVRAQTGYSVRTLAQHQALPIVWGYPFTEWADRRRGVDGYPIGPYPQDTYTNHKGVDYFTTPRIGSSIHAIADGQVTVVNQRDTSALGAYVRVTHANGVYSEYGHMTAGSIVVSPGQQILRGAKLGLTGWTGQVIPKAATTAHLHLTIQSWASGLVVWNPLWLVEDAPLAGSPPPLSEDLAVSNERISRGGVVQVVSTTAATPISFDGRSDSDLATGPAGGPGMYRLRMVVDYGGLVTGRTVQLQLSLIPDGATTGRRMAAFVTSGVPGGAVSSQYDADVRVPVGHRLVLTARANGTGVSISRFAVRTLNWQATG